MRHMLIVVALVGLAACAGEERPQAERAAPPRTDPATPVTADTLMARDTAR